jgi:hypothetical protein
MHDEEMNDSLLSDAGKESRMSQLAFTRFAASPVVENNADILNEIHALESQLHVTSPMRRDHRQHLTQEELEKIVKILRWLRCSTAAKMPVGSE